MIKRLKKWMNWFTQTEFAKKLGTDIAAKLTFTALISLVSLGVTIYALTTKEPAFLHKTWKSEDGSVVLYGDSIDSIEITGRPEGPLILEITKHSNGSNRFEGDLRCADHGGTIGHLTLELEPYNQIHLRTKSNISGQYELDVVLRIAWPSRPVTTTMLSAE